jgi:cell wall integrity and stress response component
LHIDRCFCADIYPIRVSRVDDSHCSWPCPGYDKDACGGAWAYSVFNTGLEVDVEYEGDDSSNTAADASASTSTIMANADPATSDPSQCSESTLTILKDVVDEVKMVAGKFIKKIQAIFKESTEETKELEEEMDL